MAIDAQQRIKQTLGDLVFQLSVAHSRIEELEAELEKYKPKETDPDVKSPPQPGVNGGMGAQAS